VEVYFRRELGITFERVCFLGDRLMVEAPTQGLPVTGTSGGGSITPPAQQQALDPIKKAFQNSVAAFRSISQGDNQSYVRLGTTGDFAKATQSVLLEWAKISGSQADKGMIAAVRGEFFSGKFGPESEKLLKAFQNSVRLNKDTGVLEQVGNGKSGLVADGVLGIRTLNAMSQWVVQKSGSEPQNGILADAADALKGCIATASVGNFEDFKAKTGGYFNADDGGLGDGGFLDPLAVINGSQGSRIGRIKFQLTPEYLVDFFSNQRNRQIFGLQAPINLSQANRIMNVLAVIRMAESSADENAYSLKNYAGSPAWGAYQFIPSTWNNLKSVSKGIISGERNDGTEMGRLRQDLAAVLLVGSGQANVLDQLVNGTNPDGVIRAIAKVWAGIPLPGTNRSHYEGFGGNTATIASSAVRSAVTSG